MKNIFSFILISIAFANATTSLAQDKKPDEIASLTVTAEGIGSDGYIDTDFAFCMPAATGHVKDGHNKSIGLSWSKGPVGTKSYAIIAVDTDVPASFDNANQEGKTISINEKRRDFYHWVLFDIPAEKLSIPAYSDSQELSKHGKSEIKTPYGVRGINDYAPYMAGNPERAGVYAGYDGPCPPWNDELVHNYHFKVLALNVESLKLEKPVNGTEAMAAIMPHIIGFGEVVGKYSLKQLLQ
ncbi:MAG: YbhB/YbcL family Raf kinase inhibitor-like protein [Pseudomonadota bacterium]